MQFDSSNPSVQVPSPFFPNASASDRVRDETLIDQSIAIIVAAITRLIGTSGLKGYTVVDSAPPSHLVNLFEGFWPSPHVTA